MEDPSLAAAYPLQENRRCEHTWRWIPCFTKTRVINWFEILYLNNIE